MLLDSSSGVVALAANRAPAGALGPLAWLPFASRYVHLLSTTLAAFAAGAVLVPKKLQKVLAALLGTDIKVHNALLCIIPHTSVVLKFFLPDQNTGSSCLIFYLPACLL